MLSSKDLLSRGTTAKYYETVIVSLSRVNEHITLCYCRQLNKILLSGSRETYSYVFESLFFFSLSLFVVYFCV